METFNNISEVTSETDWREAAEVLRALRPALDVEQFVAHRETLIGEGYRLLSKRENGRIVSIASYTLSPHALMRREMLIHDMATKPDAQGEGHASAILSELRKIARQKECGRLFVHTRNAANFYERNGFTAYSTGMILVP
jgi:N-acetylglutamate synthase-like GNAT family acetyltransferase